MHKNHHLPAGTRTASHCQWWLFGQGFNVSNLLVPARESDMIFTVVAEDFGFVGALALLDFICVPDLPHFKNYPTVQ